MPRINVERNDFVLLTLIGKHNLILLYKFLCWPSSPKTSIPESGLAQKRHNFSICENNKRKLKQLTVLILVTHQHHI